MIAYFGKDFTYRFYPLTSDGLSYENLPAAPLSVYLFSGYPSVDDAENGTTNDGNYTIEETVGAWSDTPDGKGKEIDFSAVNIPPDLGNSTTRNYYIVINTELQTGNYHPPIVKEIAIELLKSQESVINVSVSDILSLEPNIKLACRDYGDLDKYIDAATREVRLMYSDCDSDFSSVVSPAQLNYAVVTLAISKAYYGQSRDPQDIYAFNGSRFSEAFSQALKVIAVMLDKDRDGIAEEKRKAQTGIRTFRISR